MPYKKVTHVIFDMDGLLLESESIYSKIMEDIGKPFGKPHTHDLKMKLLGRDEHDIARITIAEMQLPYSNEEFLEIYRALSREALKNPALMPGAKRLVEHLHKYNIPIAVATSSSQESMELKSLPHQQMFKLFHHIVCGTTDPDVKKGKPAPDIFLVCASRFPNAPNPEQCLVFEDAPNGVTGAITGGMQAVIVPDPHTAEDQLQHATQILRSLEDFQPELFGLPAFN